MNQCDTDQRQYSIVQKLRMATNPKPTWSVEWRQLSRRKYLQIFKKIDSKSESTPSRHAVQSFSMARTITSHDSANFESFAPARLTGTSERPVISEQPVIDRLTKACNSPGEPIISIAWRGCTKGRETLPRERIRCAA